MELRPCIDIHNGKVKQIVGDTLSDEGDSTKENFVSERDADFFAEFYRDEGLMGGHVILLNAADSPYYEATKTQAKRALMAYPGGLQVGGGMSPENAGEFLDAGASHIIVTSYLFADGRLDERRLLQMERAVGRDHLVIDLSCRRRHHHYYVVTDRWQSYTEERVDAALLERLSGHCDEFLIHGVDVEGQRQGVEEELVDILSDWEGIPITYAGGVASYEDIELIRKRGQGRLNVTVGSALDLFGGELNYETVKQMCHQDI